MLGLLAWRNLWRMPRRTIIILISIIIGTWGMVFMKTLMTGLMHQMIESSIRTLTGHVQVHRTGFFNDPSIDYTMDSVRDITRKLQGLPENVYWTQRVRVPGVVSNARNSAGIVIVGIVPEDEARVSFIGSAVAEGQYLTNEDEYGILIGESLARKFETEPGKKLVLTSQDREGRIASGGFRITGIFRAETDETEEHFAFILLPSAQRMLKMGDAVSELCFMAPNMDQVPPLRQWLQSRIGNDTYEVMSWKELLPLITSTLEIWDGFIYIWYAILFVAMAFGLVNTMLIAVYERFRELGVLRAIGMKSRWIITQITIEAVWLLIIGIVLGDLLTLAAVQWLVHAGGINLSAYAASAEQLGFPKIIFPVFKVTELIVPNALVLFLGIVVNLYPAFKAGGIAPVQAMTHN
ncbi:MAG: ABC transporter permease [Deltaproteobacteria bacterium]|nr:ABC transporter permease [Deltaproteobacteria bacterium]